MRRELIYLPAASQDFIEGKDYYEELSPGTGGQRFENAFKEAIRQTRGLIELLSMIVIILLLAGLLLAALSSTKAPARKAYLLSLRRTGRAWMCVPA
jgi:hypothetical protein